MGHESKVSRELFSFVCLWNEMAVANVLAGLQSAKAALGPFIKQAFGTGDAPNKKIWCQNSQQKERVPKQE